MTTPPIFIAMAFPVDPEKRLALRRIVKMPMAVYADTTEMPCVDCGEVLAVGPRVSALVRTGSVKVCCPLCAVKMVQSGDVDVAGTLNLGNTAIRHETDYE